MWAIFLMVALVLAAFVGFILPVKILLAIGAIMLVATYVSR